jgi:hypothetical protein
LLARNLAKLQSAPYVTSLIGLLFQLCPAVLILTSGENWLQRRSALVVALLLIATPPASEEVWLNTLHSQFHLALCAALILAFQPANGKVEVFRRGLLLLGPLSGPAAAAVLPLFALRAAVERSWARAVQACILGIGVAAQLTFFYSAVPGRSYSIEPLLLLSVVFARHVVVPLLGRSGASDFVANLHDTAAGGHVSLWPPLIAVGVFGLFVVALLLRRRMDLIWLFAAGCCVMVLTYFGSLGTLVDLISVNGGGRYYYVPQAILALVVLGLAATGHDIVAKLSWIVTIWLVVVGAGGYFWTSDYIAHGPDWRSEVKAWHKDPNHALNIWPRGWVMQLPPHGRDPTP